MSKFSERLREFGFGSYDQYLNSPEWAQFRRRWKKNKKTVKACAVCGSNRIQLHHTTYARVCQEKFSDILALCEEHHGQVHDWLKEHGKKVESTNAAVHALSAKDEPRGKVVSFERSPPREWKSAPTKAFPLKTELPAVDYRQRPCEGKGCKNTARSLHTLCRRCERKNKKPNTAEIVAVMSKHDELRKVADEALKQYRQSRLPITRPVHPMAKIMSMA